MNRFSLLLGDFPSDLNPDEYILIWDPAAMAVPSIARTDHYVMLNVLQIWLKTYYELRFQIDELEREG